MSNTRTEVRRAVNEGNIYVREEDLKALDKNKKEAIPSFRSLGSDTPTRLIGKSEIWQRASDPEEVRIQSTIESKGQRWGTGARAVNTLI
jgi:hypothetical protein